MAQNIADSSGFEIRVISIKKTDEKKRYILFYISREARNDRTKYFDLAVKLRKVPSRTFEMRHIKDINGDYAVY